MGRPKKPRYMHTFDPVAGRRTVSSKAFQNRCGELMREVARTGTELVVVLRGQPHVVISPAVHRVGSAFVGSGAASSAALDGVPLGMRGGASPELGDADLLALLTRPVAVLPAQAPVPGTPGAADKG